MKKKRRYILGERPIQIGMFEVTAKPASKLRRTFWDILPYWQGSRPEFKVVFEALFNTECKYNYICAIRYPDDRLKPTFRWQLEIPRMIKGKKWETVIDDMHLVFTGDTFLSVAEIKGTQPLEYERVFLFHVTDRSWLALALVVGLLAGGLSILGSWLSSNFF